METDETNSCIVQPFRARLRVCRHMGLCFSAWQRLPFYTLDQPTTAAFLKNELPGFAQQKTRQRISEAPHLLRLPRRPTPAPSPSVTPSSRPSTFSRPLSPVRSALPRQTHKPFVKRQAPCGQRTVPRNQAICCHREKKTRQKKQQLQTNKQTQRHTYCHMCTFACGGPVVTSRQRRQTAANGSHRISMWRASLWNPGTIWALHCWQNTLRDFGTCHLHIRGKKMFEIVSFTLFCC